jgi:glycosyltransferase involved in cell wall biosynthesis
MTPSDARGSAGGTARLSLIMPCYNEEESVPVTVPRLLDAFASAGHEIELIAVDNGSSDPTGVILDRLLQRYPGRLRVHRVEVNQGYGNGLLSGIPLCNGDWVGFIPADGQVDEVDVVRLWEVAAASRGDVVAKVRRRFRMDGITRKLVSIAYNGLIRLMWPRLNSLDVNGAPKMLPLAALQAMQLESRGWFLDPEIMIKAHYMGLRVLEYNVFARMRGNGVSHVRAETCVEFLRNLLIYRFSREVGAWRDKVRSAPPALVGGGAAHE